MLIVVCLPAVGAASAFAASPWWHVNAGARPTYLQYRPGLAPGRDEVQELVTTEDPEEYFGQLDQTFFSLSVNHEFIGEFLSEPLAKEFGYPLFSLENLQKALQKAYGPLTTVEEQHETASKQPLAPGERRYLIVSSGSLADGAALPPIEASANAGTAEANVVTQGEVAQSDGELVVWAENVGGANMTVPCVKVAAGAGRFTDAACSQEALAPAQGEFEKSPARITDTLPAGLRAVAVQAITLEGKVAALQPTIPCALESGSRVSCELDREMAPYGTIEMRILVAVRESAHTGEEPNRVAVAGGGAPSLAIARPVTISGVAVPFGLEQYEMTNEAEGGGEEDRAGAHQLQTTFTVGLNEDADLQPPPGTTEVDKPEVAAAGGLPKNLHFKLPVGWIGNPQAIGHCTTGQFLATENLPTGLKINECPQDSAVGVASVTINEPRIVGSTRFVVPLYNLEPHVGEPARFGFNIVEGNAPVFIDTSLRTGSDYGITVEANSITQTAGLLSSTVTVWGVPGAPAHDESRGWRCLAFSLQHTGSEGECLPSAQTRPPPFLSLPTSCEDPLLSEVLGDSWAAPGHEQEAKLASFQSPPLVGCEQLPFAGEIKVTPDGQQASRPTGLSVDVHVPQEGQLNGTGLAQSNIRAIRVTLPEGVTLNPSGADGLQACSEQQIGYLPGESHPPGELRFTPTKPGSVDAGAAGEGAILEPGSNWCPDASKIGTVHIKTPLLPHELEGAVYLASPQNFRVFPQENPFESLLAMYIVAEDPETGSLVKLPGKVELGGEPGVEGLAPGQIRSTFQDTPQLAFEDAKIDFFGGERAPLATPDHCGAYTTDASFTPWSGNAPVSSQSTFEITSGPNGSACPPAALPFNATLASGTTNNNAGGFSDLTTTLSRPDGDQSIQSVTLHYPDGLSGLLSGVKLCGENEANAGTCGEESKIGETIVSLGVGGDPFTVTGGRVYITGPYEGAPFGLSIVNPAKAGPFDLQEGRPVVVRAKVEVDPVTAALTITTDPSGAHSIPSILEGFPLQIQHVNVLVNRPGFTFNPTNCNPAEITGEIKSAEGASAQVKDPFQVTNCAVLKYTPTLAVTTAAKASKVNGASLHFKIAYPKGAMGSQSWMKEMKFDIPKQLPARLTTIQKACLASTFEHNRAACPPASIIGHLVVHTPVLPVPLEGPLYFVSYGGAAFPDAVAVIKGYGVTIESHGHTFINGKTGVTSATFESVPDVPFESIEVTVPSGPFSEFGANLPAKAKDDFCGQKLVMPIRFKAQNGLEITQNTPVGVTGCPKALTKAQKLAAALKACRHKHGKKRASCERAARKAYGAKVAKKSKKAHR